MFELEVIASFWATVIGAAASVYANLVYDPQKGQCFKTSENFFTINFIFSGTLDILKVIFYALSVALTVNAIIHRRQHFYKAIKRLLFRKSRQYDASATNSESNADLPNTVTTWLVYFYQRFMFIERNVNDDSQRTSYWIKFFDKWIFVSVVKLVVSPFLSGSTMAISAFVNFYWVFEAFAVLTLLQNVYENLSKRNKNLANRWEYVQTYARIIMIASLALSIISLVFFGLDFSGDSNVNHRHFADLGLLICRIFIVLAIVVCFVDALEGIQYNYRDLLNAVLHNDYIKGSMSSSGSNSVVDGAGGGGGGGGASFVNSQIGSRHEPTTTATPTSDKDSGKKSDLEMTNNYTLIYFEISKLVDLVKMVSVILLINVINTLNVIFVFFIPQLIGNELLFIMLFFMQIGIPLIYAYIIDSTHSDTINAVDIARDTCVKIFYLATLFIFSIMGTNYGCQLVSTFRNDDDSPDIGEFANKNRNRLYQSKFIFFDYFNRAMIYQSIISFTLSFLTSPGARAWYQLAKNLLAQIILLPFIWPPPFTVARLHEVSGLNFVVGSLWHTLCWIFFFSFGYFEIKPFLVPVVTGTIMLVMCIKLVWPPGKPFPGAQLLGLQRLETFLKDSKYGSYHVYLAIGLLVLYCFHSAFLFPNLAFPYFVLPLLGWGLLRLVHSSTRQYIWSKLFSKKNEVTNKYLYKIKSTSRIPLRGFDKDGKAGRNSTCAVTLSVTPPTNIPFSNFEGSSCDLVMLRNTSSPANANLECVHYFSVVSIQPMDDSLSPQIDVTLLIQVTARPDGITTLLTKQDYEEDRDDSNTSKNSIANCGFALAGLVKSSSLQAVHSPSIVAFAFDSGSAAFCSLFRQRSKTREIIDRTGGGKVVFHDLCVVWVSFIVQRVRGEIQAANVAKAVEDLCTLQHYLYQKSGGRGTKFLFVITGIPPEWTPAPECPSHKTRGVEEDVAKILGVDPGKVKPDEWYLEEKTIERDLFRPTTGGISSLVPTNFNDFVSMISKANERESAISSNNGSELTNSISGLGSLTEQDQRSQESASQQQKSSLSKPLLGQTQTITSLSSSSPRVQGQAQRQGGSKLSNNSSNSSIIAPRSLNYGSSAISSHDLSLPFALKSGLMSIRHTFNEASAESISSSESTFTSATTNDTTDFLQTPKERSEVFLQIQSKEESWVPLRHALASKWNVFLGCLEFRIHSLFKWLYSSHGPDYTSIFITEHQSDVGIFRDFRYQDIYNEINRVILENQIRYCKNPSEFLNNKIQSNGDPVNCDNVSCSVLYSGDFQSNKKDNLGAMVKKLATCQDEETLVPATLSFVPDG